MHIAISEDVAESARGMGKVRNPFIPLSALEALCEGNETLQICLEETVNYSMKYAETVCRFEQIVAKGQRINEDGTREEIERVRSTIHDSTIDAINILSRNLKKFGKDNKWLAPIVANGRAGYGKFAILLAFETVAAAQPQTNEVAHV